MIDDRATARKQRRPECRATSSSLGQLVFLISSSLIFVEPTFTSSWNKPRSSVSLTSPKLSRTPRTMCSVSL